MAKINSGAKGRRAESEVCRILSDRFGKPFNRVVGSGNRWAQVESLPEHAKNALLGDICPPEGFLWVIEVKSGYEDKIDFHSLFGGNGCRQLDEFFRQAHDEADRSGRKPLILYKRSRRPWLAMVRAGDLPAETSTRLHYAEWVILGLDDLLRASDDHFFGMVRIG
ncbi:putative PDDEXK endonuclease [Singulisphaera rosea]